MSKKSSQSFLNLSVCVVLLVCLCIGCREIPILKDKINEFDIENAEKAIKENPEFQELNSVCERIPIPEGSTLSGKIRGFNTIALSSSYHSNDDFDKLDNFFREYFRKNQWESVESKNLNRTSEFKKGMFRVAIQFGGISGGATYSVFCEKLKDIKNKRD